MSWQLAVYKELKSYTLEISVLLSHTIYVYMHTCTYIHDVCIMLYTHTHNCTCANKHYDCAFYEWIIAHCYNTNIYYTHVNIHGNIAWIRCPIRIQYMYFLRKWGGVKWEIFYRYWGVRLSFRAYWKSNFGFTHYRRWFSYGFKIFCF